MMKHRNGDRMNNCLVSIIIPVYNVEKYLKRCLDSVINQTYSNIEIILVNDGSTDNSLNICINYANQDNRIKLISQKNQGLSAARNVGIDSATGNYLMFLDSDDWLDVEVINECMSYMEQGYDIIMFDPIINGKKRNISIQNEWSASGKEAFLKLFKLGADAFYITVWQYIYRSAFIKEEGLKFCPGLVYEDEVWTRCALISASRFLYCEKRGYYYENRENSIITSTLLDKKSKAYFTIAKEIDRFRNNSKHVDREINEILVYTQTKFLLMSIDLLENSRLFNLSKLNNIIEKSIFSYSGFEYDFDSTLYCDYLCDNIVEAFFTEKRRIKKSIITNIIESSIGQEFVSEWNPTSRFKKVFKQLFIKKKKGKLYNLCMKEALYRKIKSISHWC